MKHGPAREQQTDSSGERGDDKLGLQRRQPADEPRHDELRLRRGRELISSSAGAAYSYNTLNQSTSIKRAGGSAQSQAYAGASQFERIEKQNGTGTYTQFGESILGMLIRKQGTGTYYTRLPDGSLLSQRTPAGTHYYLEDGLGSITGMTDANGALVAEYRLRPLRLGHLREVQLALQPLAVQERLPVPDHPPLQVRAPLVRPPNRPLDTSRPR